LADENFRFPIVLGVRRHYPQIDIMTAVEAGIRGLADDQVLAFAAQHTRILLSHDVHSLPGHFAGFLATGHHSPGVLLYPHDGPIGAAIESIALVWQATEPGDWMDRLDYFP
jgi:hypothetical protein